jgi:hypothetical protein
VWPEDYHGQAEFSRYALLFPWLASRDGIITEILLSNPAYLALVISSASRTFPPFFEPISRHSTNFQQRDRTALRLCD